MLSATFRIISVCLTVLILAGCAATDPAAPPQENMEVSVDFREIHRCSRISPEITVAYAPKGTKFYDVRLVEYGETDRFLGGGKWNEDGTGIIPEGALTSHYTGPCPPRDREIEYAYVISAMESEKGQPLEVRLFRFRPQ